MIVLRVESERQNTKYLLRKHEEITRFFTLINDKFRLMGQPFAMIEVRASLVTAGKAQKKLPGTSK